jgi:hypothetical protein
VDTAPRRRSRLQAQREQLRPYVPRQKIAKKIKVDVKTIWRWEAGESDPYQWQHEAIAEHYQWPLDRIAELLARDADLPAAVPDVDGIDAIELVRRSEATDLGPGALAAIVGAVEGLASDYTHMVPAKFLTSLRTYQGYVRRLLDGRATLAQRRELMRQGGWLSLLVATASMDVGHDRAAGANLQAAHTMAGETGDDELAAWAFETEAWQALSAGRLDRAADLCRAGLDVAPPGTSAYVQLCTQTARACARLGNRQDARHMVDVSLAEVARRPSPVGPENHFVVDQRRVLLHCAGALVWLGGRDSTVEDYVRRSVADYESGDYAHHLAVARMNLAILLAETGQPSEATHVGQNAVDEAAWRLCHTDLFLTDSLHDSLTRRYDDTVEVRSWTESYAETRRAIAARQSELITASTSALPDTL